MAKKKNLPINVPSDWNIFLRQISARSEGTKLQDFKMNPSDFKNYSTLFQGTSIVLFYNKSSADMQGLRIRWLQFLKNED